MNRTAFLLRELLEHPDITQRALADKMYLSLGGVNALFSSAVKEGLVKSASAGAGGRRASVTEAGLSYLAPFRMDGAVIMAAGFGSRFRPLTFDTPKGLLKVLGERMLERQIRQLHEAGITDITLVVGYLKEKFEYLIDKFGVKLLYNPDFAEKNNISSVYYARKLLYGRNMYLLSSDNWMRENMFHAYEPGAWYSAAYAPGATKEWVLDFNKKGIITRVKVGGQGAWYMYGPVCLTREFSAQLLPRLEEDFSAPGTEQYYWENVYMDLLREKKGKAGMPQMAVNRQPADQVYEFEDLEELRAFDPYYQDHSDNEAMELISRVLKVPQSKIRNISCPKSGMTNQSFVFSVEGTSYICRVPGPGTEMLINRREEYESLKAAEGLGITEKVVWFDPEKGYKISVFYENSRNADPESPEDMQQCMKLVRRLHESGLQVGHSFDLRERIAFYEKLCLESGGIPFEDYSLIRQQMNALLDLLDRLDRPRTLCHIDSVADNFIFTPSGLRLIDWEYAGMADPLTDIAMCAIYSYYDESRTARLMQAYFGRDASPEERDIVRCYMALGGFLWALWAVYKENIGKPFGEYTLIMYRYAKDCFRAVQAAGVLPLAQGS